MITILVENRTSEVSVNSVSNTVSASSFGITYRTMKHTDV